MEDLLAALLGEEPVGDVLQDGLLQDVRADADPGTLRLADAEMVSAVVVAVIVDAAVRVLARRFEQVTRAARAALDEAREEHRARRRSSRVPLRVSLLAEPARHVEQLAFEDR